VAEINPIGDPLSSVRTTIKSRRVTRKFSDKPVPLEYIYDILEAARWAPSGGKRWLNCYIVIRDVSRLRKIRAASPGILSFPQAIIIICIDTSKITSLAFNDSDQGSVFVDVGTAAENMLLTAAELGVGACPVMSFYKPAVQTLLNLPPAYNPAMMILLGFPVPHKYGVRLHSKVPKLDEIVHWEYFGGKA
jgi:nitroreductase